MLFKVALVLLIGWLIAWVLGIIGVHALGKAVHVVLLFGLMLMLAAFARAREDALQQEKREHSEDQRSTTTDGSH